jgi:hypothetical protein
MTRYFRHRCNRPVIAGALLIALLFQAMIPAGFMPAVDGKFALQVCPHDSNHHTGGHSHVEFCPFGALPGAAPLPHVAVWLPSPSLAQQLLAEPTFSRVQVRFERAHRPRGPPALTLG